jgi:retron-type reverse transcriptase
LILFRKPNKKGDKPKDFRPITLINGWVKVAEALFAKKIEDELNKRNYFSSCQFGFTKGKTTVDAIKKVLNDCNKLKKKYKYVILLAFDFSSAEINNVLNATPQIRISKAVESINIDRKVKINEQIYSTSTGTPQGGKASPLLFKIAINRIIKKLEEIAYAESTAFADDLLSVISANSMHDLQSRVNIILNKISDWCKQANLKLNEDKT